MCSSWANKDDVWNNLLRKDQLYLHDKHVMERHPNLQPKMRAVLLDWLLEVGVRFMVLMSPNLGEGFRCGFICDVVAFQPLLM